MIAVCVDENGNLKTCTCRWNHDNGGDDHIMNEAEISRTVDMNFYGVFKPNNTWQKKIEDVKDQLKIGVDFREIFAFYGHEYDGWRRVRLDKKYNYINSHNELISDIWFDKANDFERGMGQVELNDKQNLINYDGKVICEEWYSFIYGFSNGVALVKNVDELYSYFADKKTSNEFLTKNKLKNICTISFPTPLDYAHYSLALEQREDAYYNMYKINNFLAQNGIKL